MTKPLRQRQERLDLALRDAVLNKDVEGVRLALKNGGNPDTADYTGFTMLHFAAVRDNTQIIEILLDGGATLEAVTNQGMTAVHLAARSGRPEIIKTLAARGANINAHDDEGETPLRVALRYGEGEAAQMLVQIGVKPDAEKIRKIRRIESVDAQACKDALYKTFAAHGMIRANQLKALYARKQLRRGAGPTP